jgi:nitric oxide reductase subunit B
MKRLWISFAIVFFGSFAVLGWIGTRIYQEMPPIPARVVDSNGAVVTATGDIQRGQNVWQALGGMEVGSARRPSMPENRCRRAIRWVPGALPHRSGPR